MTTTDDPLEQMRAILAASNQQAEALERVLSAARALVRTEKSEKTAELKSALRAYQRAKKATRHAAMRR